MNEFQTGFCYRSGDEQDMFFRGNRLLIKIVHKETGFKEIIKC
jgi:hypothetical protein